MGRWLAGIPVLNEVEKGAGTVATGAVDSLIADPGNALLGVNADNMGAFEENAAGTKAMSLATLGLGGEGGLLSDVLMPGQGTPGERESNQSQETNNDGGGGITVDPQVILLAGAAAVAAYVVVRA